MTQVSKNGYKGLTSYFSFRHKGELADFQTLKTKHSLNNHDFFRYLQMRNRITEIAQTNEKKDNRIVNIFQMACNTDLVRKTVARFYQGFQVNKTTNIIYVKKKWGKRNWLGKR